MQNTDAAHAFRNPLTFVINEWVGTPSSGAIVHSEKVDNIYSFDVAMMSVSVVRIAQSRRQYLVTTVIDVIVGKNVVTKIMS